MPKTLWSLLLGACRATGAFAPLPAHAALDIQVTSGVRDPIPIAIAPFARSAGDEGLDVADVIQHDLEGSGRFKALPRARMPASPTQVTEVAAAAWKASGSDYLVVGRVVALEGGNLGAEFDLINKPYRRSELAARVRRALDGPTGVL